MKKALRFHAVSGIMLVLASVLTLSCVNPILDKKSDSVSAGTGGSLSLSIPIIAPGLAAVAETDSSRAYAFAYTVHFTLFDSTGAVEREDTKSASAEANSITGLTLYNVPVGTGYRIELEIINPRVSASVPVVCGTASGINVTLNATTAVTVKCVPVTATSMVIGTPVTLNLGALSEAWYETEIVSGTAYYFTEETNSRYIGLFKEDGTQIAWFNAYYPYTADYTGTLYIGVAQYRDTALENKDTVLVSSTEVPQISEGSVATPVSLTAGVARTFTIARGGSSYYSFTAETTGTYCLKLPSLQDYYAYLYSNAAFSSTLASAYGIRDGISLDLTGGTAYYLKLTNSSSSDALISEGIILDPVAFAEIKESEGSRQNPVTLALGTPYSAVVGIPQYDCDSYYTFTTNDTDYDYTLDFSNLSENASFSWYLYGPTGYSSSYITYQSISAAGSSSVALSPATTYYLDVFNRKVDSNATFDIAVTPHPQTYLDVTPGTSWASASVAAGQKAVWFKVPVSESKRYSVYLDEADSGSGNMTVTGTVYAYRADRLTTLNVSGSCGYETPAIATVPSGDTYMYLKFVPYSGTAGTFRVKVTERSEINETISLGETWTDGSITADTDAVWYQVPVTAGKGYSVYLDNSRYGSSSKSADVSMYVYRENKTSSYGYTNSAYAAPYRFTAAAGETYAYIKVMPYNTTASGSFGLRVLERVVTDLDLSVGDTWTAGTIDYEDEAIWYHVPVTAGQRYIVYMDNATEGSRTYTAATIAQAYRQNKTASYTDYDSSAYATGLGLQVAAGETELYVKVTSASSGGIGSYALKVVEMTDPVYDLAVGDTWTPGSVTALQSVWYRVPVTAGSSYSVWWADRFAGSSTLYSSDIKVSGYKTDQAASYFSAVDSGYTTAQTVTITADETYLYLKVVPYSSYYAGTFAVKVTAN